MRLSGKKPWYVEYLLIILGTGLMALAINSAFDPAGLVTGGFSGIAIIVKQQTAGLVPGGVPLWLTNLILNVPLFLAAIRMEGFSFMKKALAGNAALTLWLAFLPVWDLSGGDLLLGAVYGGLIQGVGIGLVFLGRGTTGGTDMLSALIQKYMRHYSISQILMVIDGLVVLAGVYVFGVRRALYAVIAVYIVTKVSDGLIEGMKFSKAVYIITEKPQEISTMLMDEVGRGVTGISARGMYSEKEKLMLFCVVNTKEIVTLKERVAAMDPNAFVIVTDAREVYGEGFIQPY